MRKKNSLTITDERRKNIKKNKEREKAEPNKCKKNKKKYKNLNNKSFHRLLRSIEGKYNEIIKDRQNSIHKMRIEMNIKK